MSISECSAVGSALASGARGRRFEPDHSDKTVPCGATAAHLTLDQKIKVQILARQHQCFVRDDSFNERHSKIAEIAS